MRLRLSSTSSPPWSTYSGITSWIGQTILFASGLRTTTVVFIHLVPLWAVRWQPFHTCRGRTSTCSRATSPLLNLVDAYCCRTSWKLLYVVKYSLCQSLQKSSAYFCRILNSFVRLPFVSGSGPDGITAGLSPIRKCAGINAPASSSACTMGLELMAASRATRDVSRHFRIL